MSDFVSEEVAVNHNEASWGCMSDMVTPMKLIRSVTPQSALVLAWVFASIWVMNLFNAFVYSRLPTSGALPDVVADSYKTYGNLRDNKAYMGKQPADMLSFFLDVAQNLMKDETGQFMQILGPGQDSMACILGAILCGFGIGIVFVSNGSTGGTDIVAAVINKHRNISLGRVLLYIDLVTISSCYFFFNDWRMVVFGYVALVVMNYTLDMVVNSSRQDVQFIIFTKKYQMLSDRIIHETSHSVTVWDSEGCYTHSPIKVMITIVHKNEAIHILRMIHEVDPEAFVSQSRAEGVYGNGFNKIKIK